MFLHVEHVFGSLDLPSENGFENDTPDIYWISWGSQCPSLETQTRRSTTSCAEANESQPSIRLIRQNAWTLTSRLFNLQSLPPCPDSLANETTIAQGVQVNLSLCFWAKYYQYIYNIILATAYRPLLVWPLKTKAAGTGNESTAGQPNDDSNASARQRQGN